MAQENNSEIDRKINESDNESEYDAKCESESDEEGDTFDEYGSSKRSEYEMTIDFFYFIYKKKEYEMPAKELACLFKVFPIYLMNSNEILTNELSNESDENKKLYEAEEKEFIDRLFDTEKQLDFERENRFLQRHKICNGRIRDIFDRALTLGLTSIVKLLLDAGYKLELSDDAGFRYIFRYGYTDIMRLLINREIINVNDIDDRLLDDACDKNYLEFVKLLLENGLIIKAIEPVGKTTEMVQLLHRYCKE